MLKQSALVGQVISKKTLHITDNMLKRIQNALEGWPKIKDQNHILSFFLGALGEHDKIYERLHIKAQQQLHTRESITVSALIHVGDIIEIETTIADLYEQQAAGNPLGFVVTNVWGKKGDNIVFCAQRVTAVRGGFSRRL